MAALATLAGVAGVAALLGAFDGKGEAAAPQAIVGHVFRSVSVEQEGRPMPLFDGVPVWVTIERRSFGAYADCNSMGGGLRVTPSRLQVAEIGQTLVGCPGGGEQRDELLSDFFAGNPRWRTDGNRLVLAQGPTTITLEPADRPPPLPRPNPARPRDLVDARIGIGEYQTWPPGLGDSWGGGFVTVDVVVRDRRTYLTMRARCRALEARVAIHRSTLTVEAPRTKAVRCRRGGTDDFLDSVRPFFAGEVMWHLDRGRLTLQRDRSTLTLRAR